MIKRNFWNLVKEIRKVEKNLKSYSDEKLKNQTIILKNRLKKGEKVTSVLVEAYAVVSEASARVLNMRPYDVQLLGAISLYFGYLTEMNTGEGKTLTATLPLYLNALTGKSTILVTANEYLACRDAKSMGPLFDFLGIHIGVGVKENTGEPLTNEQKKEIYNADIVYTTHAAIGFDYLLENLVTNKSDRFLRKFHYVIIDEADLVLLDSAQMPLVISGSPRVQSNMYETTDFLVSSLQKDEDYIVEEKKVWLTDKGVQKAENFFGVENLFEKKYFELTRHIILALRAHTLFVKGKDYIINDNNELLLIDAASGRLLPGVKLKGGQHQALECKEHVEITQENRSVAAITYQTLFRLFPKMAGMSGTLKEAKDELLRVYNKKIYIVPPNVPNKRIDLKDVFCTNTEEKFKYAIHETITRHQSGQPVLLVTSTIFDTEYISSILSNKGIAHSVLNANNTRWEAEIVKEAGQKNAVTVSTGMAGRGTDIRLGSGVKELGGLAVIGISRMKNSRLERQVRGRAGRQGDPGCSRFYVSLQDDVVLDMEGEENINRILEKGHVHHHKIRKIINKAQKTQAELLIAQRQRALDYDYIIHRQRQLIYDMRNELIDEKKMNENMIYKIIEENIRLFIKSLKSRSLQEVKRFILDNLSYSLYGGENKEILFDNKKFKKYLLFVARHTYKEKKITLQSKRKESEYIRKCILKAIDDSWIEQVDYLQQLQFVVSGRASAQKNALFEFQKESLIAYKKMELLIKKNIMRNILLSTIHINEDTLSITYP